MHDNSEEDKTTIKRLAHKLLALSEKGSTEGERGVALSKLTRLKEIHPWLESSMVARNKEYFVKCRTHEEESIFVSLCAAYGVVVYQYKHKRIEFNFECEESLGELLIMEYEELIGQWKARLQGYLFAFKNDRIEESIRDDKDKSVAIDLDPEAEEAYSQTRHKSHGAKKGAGIKRLSADELHDEVAT